MIPFRSRGEGGSHVIMTAESERAVARILSGGPLGAEGVMCCIFYRAYKLNRIKWPTALLLLLTITIAVYRNSTVGWVLIV